MGPSARRLETVTHPPRPLSLQKGGGDRAIDFASVFLLIYSAPGGEAGLFLLPVPSVLRVVHEFVDFREGVKMCQTLFCVLPKYKSACSVRALGHTSQPSRSPRSVTGQKFPRACHHETGVVARFTFDSRVFKF